MAWTELTRRQPARTGG